MIVVDGASGTGKSTLIEALRALGFEARERGISSEPEGEGAVPESITDAVAQEAYVILDAPEEICRARLRQAGKLLTSSHYSHEAIARSRARFRQLARELRLPLLDASRSQAEVLSATLELLGLELGPLRVGVPQGPLFVALGRFLETIGHPIDPSPGKSGSYTSPGLELFSLPARALPRLVALGLLDVAFAGHEDLVESGYHTSLRVLARLPIEPVRLVAAAQQESLLEAPPSRLLVIATPYPTLTSAWASERGLAHVCIESFGSSLAFVPSMAELAVDEAAVLERSSLHVLAEVMSEGLCLFGRGKGLHHQFGARIQAASLTQS